MYNKNGGKAGTHAWTPTSESIRALSFVVVRVFELEFRRRFKVIPKHASVLGTVCFAHLPANSFLALLPKKEPVKIFQSHLEIGPRAHTMSQEIAEETVLLAKAAASLNTVRRKGKANIHIMELPEDEGIDD
ncbi:hypothetical protein B0H10DRAFT_1958754 [Mycena sp. CBHHK59/15]|nr:hypothetical protein B0H10DRAFT_1962895 [Mycena sp. CBHHK59/15]KAJ6600631.1 hypothetical protein B0H10DRAFT_1958754 [Mycena sp. CBHHK59/15]